MPQDTPPPTTTELLAGMRKALAMLAYAIGARVDAAPILDSLMANYAKAQTTGEPDVLDDLVQGMLLSLSFLAVQQHPQDAKLLEIFEGLREGPRH